MQIQRAVDAGPCEIPQPGPAPPPAGPQTYQVRYFDAAYGAEVYKIDRGLYIGEAISRARNFNAAHPHPSLLGASPFDVEGNPVVGF